MEDLEASGLLKDGNKGASLPANATTAEQQSLHTAQGERTAAASAEESSAQDTSLPESTECKRQVDAMGEEAEAVARSQPATVSSEGARSGSELGGGAKRAEQRVLGSLEGAPGWHEVLDMGGGVIYFWNQSTNEVAWQSPTAARPRPRSVADAAMLQAAAEKRDTTHDQEQAAPAHDATTSSDVVPLESGEQSARPAAARVMVDVATSPMRQDDIELPVPAHMAGNMPAEAGTEPSEEVGDLCEQLAVRAKEATQHTCGPIPPLVYLAVEAEIRLRDWHTLGTWQRAAVHADSGHCGAAGSGTAAEPRLLTWRVYEQHVSDILQMMSAALPALEAASQATEAAARPATGADEKAAPLPPDPPQSDPSGVPAPLPDGLPLSWNHAENVSLMEGMEVLEDGEVAGTTTPDLADQPPPLAPVQSEAIFPASAATALEGPIGEVDDMDMDGGPAPLPPESPLPPLPPAEEVHMIRPAASTALPPTPPWPSTLVYPQAPVHFSHETLPYMMPIVGRPWVPGIMAHPYAHFAPRHLITMHHAATNASVATSAAALEPASLAELPPLPAEGEAAPPLPSDTVGVAAPNHAEHGAARGSEAAAFLQAALRPASEPPAHMLGSVEEAAPKQREYAAGPVPALIAGPAEAARLPAAQVPELGEQSAGDEEERKRKRVAVGAGPLAKKGRTTGKTARSTSTLINKWAAVRKDLVRQVLCPLCQHKFKTQQPVVKALTMWDKSWASSIDSPVCTKIMQDLLAVDGECSSCICL